MRLQSGFIREHHGKLRFLVRLADSATIVAALFVAMRLYEQEWTVGATVGAGLAVFLFHTIGDAAGLARPWRAAPLHKEIGRLLGTWALVAAALLVTAFFLKVSEDYSRVTTMLWFVLAPLMLLVFRTGLRLFLQELRVRGRNSRSVAVVGVTPHGERLVGEIEANPWFGLRLVGYYDDRSSRRQTAHAPDGAALPLRGTTDDLVDAAKRGEVDSVYIALPLRAEERIRDLITRLADTTCSVHVVTDLLLSELMQAGFTSVGQVPVLSVYETPFYGINDWVKRAEDVILGSIILAIIAIPMLIIAAAIKLTSHGPVFFRQTRYGLNGHAIRVLKFRTMRVAEDGGSIKQATANDPRVTRLGAFLRRTSLDELPQFLNVLTGEMSIVGPRPHAVAHNELYRKQIPGYMLRHKVKPGITGWAQVNGWRGETDTLDKMAKRIEHDLAYIRSWDLALDLKIIFLTVFGRAVWRNAH